MTFKIARKYLVGLANWLNSIALQGPQSRARTKFVALAQEAIERADKERIQLLEEYAEKDENGDMIKVKDETTGQENYKVADDKLQQFTQEVNDIYEMDAEITAPEISTTLITLRNLVLNTDEKISGSLAPSYDKWCEAFEALTIN